MAGKLRPQTFHGAVAAAVSLALMAALLLVAMKIRDGVRWESLLVCWLLAVNSVAFGYYAYDKGRAKTSRSRVPELVLHGLAVAGGTLGAYAGMQVFRHKTIKGPFRLVFWIIAGFQLALLLAVIYRLYFLHAPDRSEG